MEEPLRNADPDETSLHVQRARDGDARSLEWLVRRFSPFLVKAARYHLRRGLDDLYDPGDIVNDVWLRVLPRLSDLTPRDGRFTPVVLKFLSRTMLFRISDLMKKHVRGKPRRERGRADDDDYEDPVDRLPAETTGIVTRAVRHEMWDTAVSALERLDEQDQELVVLRGIEGQSYAAIAAQVKRDTKTLAVQYQRAVAKLRKEIPGSIYEEFISE
jgi:RNA polymerase sigma factor (sigma-70 family)